MSKTRTGVSAELLKYQDLVSGVHMIRRAVEKASRAGILPSIERIGITPVEECEFISRALYSAVARQKALDVQDIVMQWNSEVAKDASDLPLDIGKHDVTSPI
jgi:hypothetical protein